MSVPILSLTTDFGADSHYVAQMKIAVLRLAGQTRLIDVTHSVGPQDVWHGAVVLEDTLPQFPAGSVHVAVVDPGVGADRAIVAADLDGRLCVAPDNGLLSLAARRLPLRQCVAIDQPDDCCPTFHGRDIMAPAAARLCLGTPLADLGSSHQISQLEIPAPLVGGGRIQGQVVLIDAFGNLLTDIRHDDLPAELSSLQVECQGHIAEGLSRTYGDASPGQLIALIGSSGRLELSIVGGDAAEHLDARRRSLVSVTWDGALGDREFPP